MYGVESYKQLPRSVPKYMQGIRLAEGERGPQQIARQAEAERSMQSHPVRGGATRNDRVWIGGVHPNTFAAASVESEKRNGKWAMLVVLGVVLWLAR